MAVKYLIVFLVVIACCECLENENPVVEESRAKKRKTVLRLVGTFLLILFGKMAVSKVAGGLFFWVVFQKFLYLIGILLNFLMKNKKMAPSAPMTPAMDVSGYHDYNTVGYSYGPPDNTYGVPDTSNAQVDSTSYGAPEWPYNRRKLVRK